MGLDFNKDTDGYGHLISTPLVALAVSSASHMEPVRTFAPPKAYYDISEMREFFPEALKLIEAVPQAWCFNSIVLDRTTELLKK